MEASHDRSERAIFKTLLWLFGTIVLLVVLGTVGYRQVRNWQQRRLAAEANALVDKGEYKRAGLAARRILQINPESSEGVRILARIADRAGARTALDLRQRVIASGTAQPEDFFALARTAIRFGDLLLARKTLEKLPEAAKQSADYHVAAADVALAQRDAVTTELELSEAARLDPANKEYVFRLAVLRLGAADSAMREKAREILKGLQSDKTFRRQATTQLIRDSLQRRDMTGARTLAEQLNNFPDKDFRDRLTILTVLYESKDADFQNFLAELKKAASSKPDEIGGVIIWLNAHRMSADAVEWSKNLSPELLAQKSVPIALADAYITLHDWSSLERLTKNNNWGEADFLRMALHARAFREIGDTPKFTAQWNEAVKKVAPNAQTVLMLSETAAKWGWRSEAIDLLWLAAKDSTTGGAALQTLYDYFVKSGDTQNLYRVLIHLEELRPNDRDIQNNLAQVSLLLNLNAEHGQKLAQNLYEKEPKNAAYVSTYAFALYARGEAPKALKLFSGLTDAQLREPTIALYYGTILAAVGDIERAAEFLDLAQKASLLPEEKALLEKARRSLAQR